MQLLTFLSPCAIFIFLADSGGDKIDAVRYAHFQNLVSGSLRALTRKRPRKGFLRPIVELHAVEWAAGAVCSLRPQGQGERIFVRVFLLTAMSC